jgi:hypothetical protein
MRGNGSAEIVPDPDTHLFDNIGIDVRAVFLSTLIFLPVQEGGSPRKVRPAAKPSPRLFRLREKVSPRHVLVGKMFQNIYSSHFPGEAYRL